MCVLMLVKNTFSPYRRLKTGGDSNIIGNPITLQLVVVQ